MTSETLHDAITLLPDDLIAEADKLRTAPQAPIPWQRYAAMAACFVLTVSGSVWCLHSLGRGGAKETASDAPSAMMQSASAIPESADAAPREEALDAAADVVSGSADNSNTACSAAVPSSVALRIAGRDYPLTGADKAALSKILEPLDFRPEDVCECIAEITIIAQDTAQYHINLEEGFVRCARGQALLTQEQIRLIQDIVDTLTS